MTQDEKKQRVAKAALKYIHDDDNVYYNSGNVGMMSIWVAFRALVVIAPSEGGQSKIT